MINQILTLSVLLLITALNPIGDAIRDNGKKERQKSIEIARDILFFLLVFLAPPGLTFIICAGLAHLFFRIALHNVLYNLFSDPILEWWHVGTTSIFDRIEGSLNWSKSSILINRIISLLFGLFLFWLSFK